MKKYLPPICAVVMVLIVGGLVVTPLIAEATAKELAQAVLLQSLPTSFILDALAGVANLALMGASKFLAFCGIFLSVSINITTHIKDIYTNVSGIQSVWITIRDISSMFIIFMLLYSAITMIIGVEGPKFGKLIVSIFLAGVFINFSLFFVKVAVDASNMVSLQFYNAIAPNTQLNWKVGTAFSDGGLSDVFMQSLKLPKIYKTTGWQQASDVGFAILFGAIGGIVMMMTAAFSFLAAALAFTARTGILLFCMALSPIYFVGMVFPQIKSQVDKFTKILKGQLVFMPVYLFLLYVSLKIISDPMFMAIFNPAVNSGAATGTGIIGPVSIGVAIQYTIAIIFINTPLIAAVSLSGTEIMGKWSPIKIGQAVAGKLSGVMGRNTFGLAGKYAGKGFDNMAARAQKSADGGSVLAKSAIWATRATRLSQATRGGIASLETSKYGSTYGRKDIEKEDKERKKVVAGVIREGNTESALNAVIKNPTSASPVEFENFEKTLGKLNKKEVEGLGLEKLKDPNVICRLSSKQFDALIEGDEFTEDEKDTLKGARKEGLDTFIGTGITSGIKNTMKNLSGKELAKMDRANLTKNGVLSLLTITQLKEMEELLDKPTKRDILTYFRGLPPTNDHKAAGWMSKPENFRNWQ